MYNMLIKPCNSFGTFKYSSKFKRSKCAFGVLEVEYLGHIVGQDGVKVDPKNIVAM